MSGGISATSLSVNLTGRGGKNCYGCNANCPFCIVTGTYKTGINHNRYIMYALPKAIKYMKMHQIDTALITSSGEPTMFFESLYAIRQFAESDVPNIEMQTNGILLMRDSFELLQEYKDCGLGTLALSICASDAEENARIMEVGKEYDYRKLIEQVVKSRMISRVSINMTKAVKNPLEFLKELRELGVRQVTLRRLGKPEVTENSSPDVHKKIAWIIGNAMQEEEINEVNEKIIHDGTRLRQLSYGAWVYDYLGMSICVATCMTHLEKEKSSEEIRSVILQPDGHGYHDWCYRGSVLF